MKTHLSTLLITRGGNRIMNRFPSHLKKLNSITADKGGAKIALSAPAARHKAATVPRYFLRWTTPSIGQLVGQLNGHIAN